MSGAGKLRGKVIELRSDIYTTICNIDSECEATVYSTWSAARCSVMS